MIQQELTEKPISVLAFAKLLSCSDTTVQNAIKEGKIVRGLHLETGKPPKIIASIAKAEWAEHISGEMAKQNPELVEALTAGRSETEGRGVASKVLEYEAREKSARAEMAELKLAELKGNLVRKDDINRALGSVGVEIRSAFESLGDRSIDNILAAGQTSRNEALLVLDEAINEILLRLAKLGLEDEPEI